MVCGTRYSFRVLAGTALIAASALLAGPSPAAESAVVMMYHRFGESAYPSTSIKIDQFKAQLAEIRRAGYVVKPLTEIVEALKSGKSLPDYTIGISVDDAFLSVYEVAWPLMRAAHLPFTVFVSTDPIDQGDRGYMTWDQIREMAKAGVTIGNHTASHAHMTGRSSSRNSADIEKANQRFRKELGQVPTLFAYPYGESSLAVAATVRKAGFIAGFGQHSGVMHHDSDFFFLPRFAFSESFGDVQRFRLAARALPLRARDITPADTLLGPKNNPPLFGFTVAGLPPSRLSRLACYVSGQGRVRVERLGDRRIEVRMKEAFRPGRTRINCTLPEKGGRWRWFGRQFVLPRP